MGHMCRDASNGKSLVPCRWHFRLHLHVIVEQERVNQVLIASIICECELITESRNKESVAFKALASSAEQSDISDRSLRWIYTNSDDFLSPWDVIEEV